MLKRSSFLRVIAGVLMLTSVAMAQGEAPQQSSRLATYRTAAGETYFALSLVARPSLTVAPSRDIVVVFDTSASQTGLYREDGLNALNGMLANLGDTDRVKLIAVDLRSVPLTEGFVAPNSAAMKKAITTLKRRVPLGATDPQSLVHGAADAFEGVADRPRSIVYIGDGVNGSEPCDP